MKIRRFNESSTPYRYFIDSVRGNIDVNGVKEILLQYFDSIDVETFYVEADDGLKRITQDRPVLSIVVDAFDVLSPDSFDYIRFKITVIFRFKRSEFDLQEFVDRLSSYSSSSDIEVDFKLRASYGSDDSFQTFPIVFRMNNGVVSKSSMSTDAKERMSRIANFLSVDFHIDHDLMRKICQEHSH